jgi:hypothetical protein
LSREKWFEKAWATMAAVPCVPVAYAWLAAEGPEWLRPISGRLSPSALEVAGVLAVLVLIAHVGWCFYRADQAE